jgi:hypothetical protein
LKINKIEIYLDVSVLINKFSNSSDTFQAALTATQKAFIKSSSFFANSRRINFLLDILNNSHQKSNNCDNERSEGN